MGEPNAGEQVTVCIDRQRWWITKELHRTVNGPWNYHRWKQGGTLYASCSPHRILKYTNVFDRRRGLVYAQSSRIWVYVTADYYRQKDILKLPTVVTFVWHESAAALVAVQWDASVLDFPWIIFNIIRTEWEIWPLPMLPISLQSLIIWSDVAG